MMFLVAGKGAHWVEAIQITCRVFGENVIAYIIDSYILL